jgi:hypothetical protein
MIRFFCPDTNFPDFRGIFKGSSYSFEKPAFVPFFNIPASVGSSFSKKLMPADRRYAAGLAHLQ